MRPRRDPIVIPDGLRAVILGCGSSAGVPRLGEGWGDCDPNEPRNRRTRCSLMVERRRGDAVTRAVIDMAPDFREQMLRESAHRLDAVLFTHDHADQTHGIDDVRPLVIAQSRPIPAYMDAATASTLTARFGYIFRGETYYPPIMTHQTVTVGEAVAIDGAGGPILFETFRQIHGAIESVGYRIGGCAYSPDVSDIPEESLPALEGLDVWIVDALRRRGHATHFNLELALQWIERVKPKRAILTNLHIDMDYATLVRELPDGVTPAFDGLAVAIVDAE